MSATLKTGRFARLYIGAVVVGHATDISGGASAELIKVYDMDGVTPAILETGNQSFAWSANQLYGIDNQWLTKLLAGTKFTMAFVSNVSPYASPYETWVNCVVTNWDKKAGMSGAIVQSVKGEAQSLVPT